MLRALSNLRKLKPSAEHDTSDGELSPLLSKVRPPAVPDQSDKRLAQLADDPDDVMTKSWLYTLEYIFAMLMGMIMSDIHAIFLFPSSIQLLFHLSYCSQFTVVATILLLNFNRSSSQGVTHSSCVFALLPLSFLA